jgi:hypothetical protein
MQELAELSAETQDIALSRLNHTLSSIDRRGRRRSALSDGATFLAVTPNSEQRFTPHSALTYIFKRSIDFQKLRVLLLPKVKSDFRTFQPLAAPRRTPLMFHIDPIELASFVVAHLSLLVGLLVFLSSLLIGAVQIVIAIIAIWPNDK